MGLSLGIVGLPNVGKSTLFNALSKAQVAASNYPFCTIDPNVGVVPVPDERLNVLAKLSQSKKVTPATVTFVDIAGLVKGASQGEGLGNQFLSHIREVDAIVQVVRCFEDGNVTHVSGKIDPIQDIEVINYELILADLVAVERKVSQLEKMAKAHDPKVLAELEAVKKVKEALSSGKPARLVSLTPEEFPFVNSLQLLTMKPQMYIANVNEADLKKGGGDLFKVVEGVASAEHSQVVPICAKIESEGVGLSDEESREILKEYGLSESGLSLLIRAGFDLLSLMTYLTTGESETRAWTIHRGFKAPQAAGVIHTDFEKGFIRAEVISYGDLVRCGTMVKAKEQGLVRLEGKDYVMQDGDVVLFRFNV